MAEPHTVDVGTPRGPARAHVHPATVTARGSVVLGHGAGGQGWSADLRLLAGTLPGQGWTVVLVDQPWRVAGKRVATPPATLDEAWRPVLAALTAGDGALPRPVVVGGRSAGARVACRTAEAVGADAVLALAFPLHPPGRPDRSRAGELRLPVEAGIPTHVVQGERDTFGRPGEVRAALPSPDLVTAVRGGHGFGRNPADVLEAARRFLRSVA